MTHNPKLNRISHSSVWHVESDLHSWDLSLNVTTVVIFLSANKMVVGGSFLHSS